MEPPPTVDVQESGCWLLRDSYPMAKGHTRTSAGGQHILAHVLLYRVFVGPIQKGKHLHHECHNPPCVNPDHLTPLMPAEHRKRHLIEKTSCYMGHPYAEHGFIDPAGRRRCRICTSKTHGKSKAKVKAERRYGCVKCGWDGVGSELVNDRCPGCENPSGRWGPQHLR
jgi:hypothetical protein